ncbi:MAG: hypothetical protein JNL63_02930 [Bacteroidia bacterium]|nr:hypothetical protein [Bacteroidia bacterium]
MQDTSPEILLIQHNIWMKKTEEERFRLGIEMIEDGRKLVECSIKNENPDITPTELKRAVFKRFYENDFSVEELNTILQHLT